MIAYRQMYKYVTHSKPYNDKCVVLSGKLVYFHPQKSTEPPPPPPKKKKKKKEDKYTGLN